MKEKALLAVSFGTAYAETRKKTIEAVEQELCEAFPDYEVYRAWTSRRIVGKVKKEEGLTVALLSEALERIASEGKKEVLIQPTYIIQGIEYQKMKSCVQEYASRFDSIRVGEPLLSSGEDLSYMTDIMPEIFPEAGKKDALILMGHGTPADNTCYHRLNELFREKGYANFRIGLVEAEPGINEILESLKGMTCKVYLAPFMLVAGNHALEDMTGDSENSWLHLLRKEGHEVICRIQGLGEYKEVRRLFVRHAKNADTWRQS
jgi:cobalamin biosynthesis Co2+ chelatase CbiK